MDLVSDVGVPMARKVTTYLLDATSTWDSTTENKTVVPADKRWLVLLVTVKNDTSGTTAIYELDSSDVVKSQLANQAANTTRTTWPSLDVAQYRAKGTPLVLDAGEKIHVVCGAAQGAAAYILIDVLEVPYL